MSDSSVDTLTSRKDCAQAVADLIDCADRHIAIFSQQLEPDLYNHVDICEQLSQLARKNRHSSIRILAQQTRNATADGHCIIRLSQRLSSSIQIRKPGTPELQNFTKSLLLIDDHSMMLLDNPERYEGSVIKNNRLHAKSELEFFNHAWENSLPDPDSRRLQI